MLGLDLGSIPESWPCLTARRWKAVHTADCLRSALSRLIGRRGVLWLRNLQKQGVIATRSKLLRSTITIRAQDGSRLQVLYNKHFYRQKPHARAHAQALRWGLHTRTLNHRFEAVCETEHIRVLISEQLVPIRQHLHVQIANRLARP